MYTVSVSRDGQFIASGSADKYVSVWSMELSEKYKYTHSESVQCVRFNPVIPNILATASAADFAIWPMPGSSLKKIKLPSKALCSAWSSDGQNLAIGLLSGLVTIRDTNGVEKITLQRSGPVWDLSFTPSRSEEAPLDTLALACWDGTLSFYNLAGQAVGMEKQLESEPCSARFCGGGDFLVVAGADKKTTLYTRDGSRIGVVVEGKDWMWRAVGKGKSTIIASGSNDGTVYVHNVTFSTVHGLYGERYAYRDGLTEVVVQHLITDGRARIKCKDYVRKLAVYRNRLAVQLSDRIVIYELIDEPSATSGRDSTAEPTAMDPRLAYRVKDKIQQTLECNLLVVTSNHLVLCLEKKLQLLDFSGHKEREWNLDAVIRYIKVVGGPSGKEGLLVGLKDGSVCRIFVDNPFPVLLVKHRSSIRCLDLSSSRQRLALVDDTSTVVIHDLTTGAQVWAEGGANSVAWNSIHDDMLCFSGNGVLNIKTGDFPLHSQKLPGFVVGFTGSKIFVLHSISMQTVDVPQSAAMARYMEERAWAAAYRVACLGVTAEDWAALGAESLRALAVDTAKSCFGRVKDTRTLELIAFLEAVKRTGKASLASMAAEIAAYSGRYSESARLHLQGGSVDRAVEMLTDLKLWEQARRFAEESGRVDVSALLLKQATWCEDDGDYVAAATIYSGLGQAGRAVSMLMDRGLDHELVEVVRNLSPLSDDELVTGGLSTDLQAALQAAGAYFRRKGLAVYARDAFARLGDTQALLQLLIDAGQWDEALALARQADLKHVRKARDDVDGDGSTLPASHSFVSHVEVARAEALALDNRFEDAQACYEAAGRPDLAVLLTQQLLVNAADERRWLDAARHCHRLSQEVGATLHDSRQASHRPELSAAYRRFKHDSAVYRAYSVIHESCTAPFFTADPSMVLQAAVFVLNMCFLTPRTHAQMAKRGGQLQISGLLPLGVSIMSTLWAIAKQGQLEGAWQLVRSALDRLDTMLLPVAWRDEFDLAQLLVRSKREERDASGKLFCLQCGAESLPLGLSTSSFGMACPSQAAASGAQVSSQGSVVTRIRSARDVSFAADVYEGECCCSCGHPTYRSAVSFSVLPLLVCALQDPSLTTRQAVQSVLSAGAHSGVTETSTAQRETLLLGSNSPVSSAATALKHLQELAVDQSAAALAKGIASPCVSMPTSLLRTLPPQQCYVLHDATAQSIRVLVNMQADHQLSMCSSCQSLFFSEELEYEALRYGGCPVCSAPPAAVFA